MSSKRTAAQQAILDDLLAEAGLDRETFLFRDALRDDVDSTDTPGVHRLEANPVPAERVSDVYSDGAEVAAEEMGAGLAFSEARARNWQQTMEMRAFITGGGAITDFVGVKVRVGDVLDQGGLLYPVVDVGDRVWFCTLPAGWVAVRDAG